MVTVACRTNKCRNACDQLDIFELCVTQKNIIELCHLVCGLNKVHFAAGRLWRCALPFSLPGIDERGCDYLMPGKLIFFLRLHFDGHLCYCCSPKKCPICMDLTDIDLHSVFNITAGCCAVKCAMQAKKK